MTTPTSTTSPETLEQHAPHSTNRAELGAWTPTLLLVALVTLARIVYLVWLCPYTLAEDEAHYWDWSRHLDWSYYSKGPGVAWAIAASTQLFGNTEWAVRLPTALAMGVAALAAAGLTRDAFRSAAAGFAAAACVILVPAFQALAILMTIDGPYLACWMLASWFTFRAMLGSETQAGHRWRWWLLAGLALAVGFWFKYTILIIIPGIAAAMWLGRARFPLRRNVAPAMLGLAVGLLIGVAPVALWNAQHDWVTVRHLMGHLGMSGGDVPADNLPGATTPWSPLWTLEYLVLVPAMIGPIFFLFITEAVDLRRDRDPQRHQSTHTNAGAHAARADQSCVTLLHTGPAERTAAVVIAAMAVPVLLLYLCVSFFAGTEGNWALAGSMGLMPLAGHAVARVRARVAAMRARGERVNLFTRPFPSHLFRAGAIVGVIAGIGMLRIDVLARLPVIGTVMPAYRITGMREHAADVQDRLDELRDTSGLEPFIMSEHYGRAGQLAFYLPGHPIVYAAQGNTGGRKTQYDIWAHTDLMNRQTQLDLTGRPAVLMGGALERWAPAFERLEDIGQLAAEPKDHRTTFFGYGYRGFPARSANDPRVADPIDNMILSPSIITGTGDGAHNPHGGAHASQEPGDD